MDLSQITTPALILDRAALTRNLGAMAKRARHLGVDLRPHMKTAKSIHIAKLATQDHGGGITVSTLAEAAYFAAEGFHDITYAVGIVPGKIHDIAKLQNKYSCNINVITDYIDVISAVSDEASRLGATLSVLIEIDSGQHRAGLLPDDAMLLPLGEAIAGAPGLSLAGVLTHAGHAYHCHGAPALEAAAEEERQAVVEAAARLRDAGLPCPVVSLGSTPTATHARSLEGVTEMRPGVYMFGDLDQMGLGACGFDDIAISVLASVIGHAPARNALLVDAGALALSKDMLASEFLDDAGYGWVCDIAERRRIADLRITSLDQEHGFVGGGNPLPYDRLPVGGRVRILPSHACLTAAGFDKYHVIDSEAGDPCEIVDIWERTGGW